MKKQIRVVLSSLLLGVIESQATTLFVGLEESYKKVDNKTSINGNQEKHREQLNIVSLKVGGVLGSQKSGDRYELSYNFGDENIVAGLETVNVELHYNLTLPSLSLRESLLPYIRFGGTYTRVSEKQNIGGSNPKYDAYGYILGLGAYYSVYENIDISLGFDYGQKKWNALTLYQGTVNVEAKDKFIKAYVGLNYLF